MERKIPSIRTGNFVKDTSSSENAWFVTGGGGAVPPLQYRHGLFRYPFRKLVKFLENFVSRGWQRLVIVLRVWCCESGGTCKIFGKKFFENFIFRG